MHRSCMQERVADSVPGVTGSREEVRARRVDEAMQRFDGIPKVRRGGVRRTEIGVHAEHYDEKGQGRLQR